MKQNNFNTQPQLEDCKNNNNPINLPEKKENSFTNNNLDNF